VCIRNRTVNYSVHSPISARWPGDAYLFGHRFLALLDQPARRARAAAGIQRLAQLTALRAAEVKQFHGIGPNAIAQLRHALAAQGLAFADEQKGKD